MILTQATWAGWVGPPAEEAVDDGTRAPHTTPLVEVLRSTDVAKSAADHPSLTMLLDFGADPNRIAIATPLLYAVLRRDARAVEALLEAGADPDATLVLFGAATKRHGGSPDSGIAAGFHRDYVWANRGLANADHTGAHGMHFVFWALG